MHNILQSFGRQSPLPAPFSVLDDKLLPLLGYSHCEIWLQVNKLRHVILCCRVQPKRFEFFPQHSIDQVQLTFPCTLPSLRSQHGLQ